MKKLCGIVLGLFLFVLGFSGVKAAPLTYDEVYDMLTKNNNNYVKIEKQGEDEYKITALPTETNLDPDYNELTQNYNMILKYADGILNYVKTRDESSFSEKDKANYAFMDALNMAIILDQITKKYFESVDESVLPSAEEMMANASKYGLAFDLGDELNYNDGNGTSVSGQEINNFSIDIDKYKNAIETIIASRTVTNEETTEVVQEVNEEETDQEVAAEENNTVANPKTGINNSYLFGIITVILSGIVLISIKNKKLFN